MHLEVRISAQRSRKFNGLTTDTLRNIQLSVNLTRVGGCNRKWGKHGASSCLGTWKLATIHQSPVSTSDMICAALAPGTCHFSIQIWTLTLGLHVYSCLFHYCKANLFKNLDHKHKVVTRSNYQHMVDLSEIYLLIEYWFCSDNLH